MFRIVKLTRDNKKNQLKIRLKTVKNVNDTF